MPEALDEGPAPLLPMAAAVAGLEAGSMFMFETVLIFLP